MMQITCDNCGKNYRVDETKIKGDKARLRCKACDNIFVINKPAAAVTSTPSPKEPSTAATASLCSCA